MWPRRVLQGSSGCVPVNVRYTAGCKAPAPHSALRSLRRRGSWDKEWAVFKLIFLSPNSGGGDLCERSPETGLLPRAVRTARGAQLPLGTRWPGAEQPR